MTAVLNDRASAILQAHRLCPIHRVGNIGRHPMYYPVIHSLQQLFISRWLCADHRNTCANYAESAESSECMDRMYAYIKSYDRNFPGLLNLIAEEPIMADSAIEQYRERCWYGENIDDTDDAYNVLRMLVCITTADTEQSANFIHFTQGIDSDLSTRSQAQTIRHMRDIHNLITRFPCIHNPANTKYKKRPALTAVNMRFCTAMLAAGYPEITGVCQHLPILYIFNRLRQYISGYIGQYDLDHIADYLSEHRRIELLRANNPTYDVSISNERKILMRNCLSRNYNITVPANVSHTELDRRLVAASAHAPETYNIAIAVVAISIFSWLARGVNNGIPRNNLRDDVNNSTDAVTGGAEVTALSILNDLLQIIQTDQNKLMADYAMLRKCLGVFANNIKKGPADSGGDAGKHQADAPITERVKWLAKNTDIARSLNHNSRENQRAPHVLDVMRTIKQIADMIKPKTEAAQPA